MSDSDAGGSGGTTNGVMAESALVEWAEQVWDWFKGGMVGEPPAPPGHHPHKPKPPVPVPPTPTPPPPVTLTVAWHNTDPAVVDTDASTWVDGLNAQVPDIQALWPHVTECTHVFVLSGQTAPAGSVKATLKPQIPEAPGALGYHDIDSSGNPFIVIGTQTSIRSSVSVSSVMSHEAAELTVDPSCVLTATAPNGKVWALEVGDPVESSSYRVVTQFGVSVEVSDFVGAAFFDLGDGALDHTGDATAPFTVAPGGYAVIDGQAVFADGHTSAPTDPDDVSHIAPVAKQAAPSAP